MKQACCPSRSNAVSLRLNKVQTIRSLHGRTANGLKV
jgi:hypothetical protein